MKKYLQISHTLAKKIAHAVRSNRHATRANFIGGLWVAGLSVILIAVVTVVGVYQFGWQNSWTAAATSIVPFPAATSSEATVSYREYITQAHGLEMYAKANPKLTAFTGAAIAKQAMAQAQKEALVEVRARQEGISVSESEAAGRLEAILKRQSNRKKFIDKLATQYGQTPADLKELLRHQLVEDKLRKKLDKQGGYAVWLRQQQASVKFNVLLPQAK